MTLQRARERIAALPVSQTALSSGDADITDELARSWPFVRMADVLRILDEELADDLGAAWAEAVAELPKPQPIEGFAGEPEWRVRLVDAWPNAGWRASARPEGLFRSGHVEGPLPGQTWERFIFHKDPEISAEGPTEVAALRALAARLRGRP